MTIICMEGKALTALAIPITGGGGGGESEEVNEIRGTGGMKLAKFDLFHILHTFTAWGNGNDTQCGLHFSPPSPN